MEVLRTLLIVFIVYYVIRIFTRHILPALFYNYMDDKMNDFSRKQRKQQQRQAEQARKHEGEVTVDYSPHSHSKNKPAKGDYTDYVEVKD